MKDAFESDESYLVVTEDARDDKFSSEYLKDGANRGMKSAG